MAIAYPEKYSHWRPEEIKMIEGRPVRFRDVCVHDISIGDVEDPDLAVAEPIWKWQESEAGQWIMANAVDQPYWIHANDPNNWGHAYKIMARLSEQNETYWRLKWSGNKK